METNSGFGNIQFSQNFNVKKCGSRNTGSIKNSANLQLFVTNSVFNMFHSANAKLSGKDLSITCSSSANFEVYGTKNSVVLERTTNAKLEGNGNTLVDTSSVNLTCFSINTKINAQNVINGNLKTQEMDVKLANSTNVNIEGGGGEVSVKNALNQTVIQSQSVSSSGIENRIEFTPPTYVVVSGRGFDRSAFESMFPSLQSNPKNSRVLTTYEKTADIDNHQYVLDGVRFTVQPKAHTYNVLISEQSVDVGSIRTIFTSPTELHVSATKDGIKHVLKFKAGHSMQSALEQCKLKFCLFTLEISNV